MVLWLHSIVYKLYQLFISQFTFRRWFEKTKHRINFTIKAKESTWFDFNGPRELCTSFSTNLKPRSSVWASHTLGLCVYHVVTISIHMVDASHGGSANYSRVISAHNLSFNLKRLNEVSMTWKRMQQTACRAFRLIKTIFVSCQQSDDSCRSALWKRRGKSDFNIFTRLCGCFIFPKLIIWKNLWSVWYPHGR